LKKAPDNPSISPKRKALVVFGLAEKRKKRAGGGLNLSQAEHEPTFHPFLILRGGLGIEISVLFSLRGLRLVLELLFPLGLIWMRRSVTAKDLLGN
jgi:hypothetical protein